MILNTLVSSHLRFLNSIYLLPIVIELCIVTIQILGFVPWWKRATPAAR